MKTTPVIYDALTGWYPKMGTILGKSIKVVYYLAICHVNRVYFPSTREAGLVDAGPVHGI